MTRFGLVLAASLLASAAVAQTTTVIETPGVARETTITKERSLDGETVTRKVESTGALGCETRTVKRTNDLGDSVTKTRTNCD